MLTHTDVPTTTWTGCYKDGWKGLIVPEAYQHPAKYSKGVIFRLVASLLDRGYLRPGDGCLDPFGGVALGGLPCLLSGVHWVGVELEARFVTLGHQNLTYWQHKFGPQAGSATLLQGDSRHLREVLQAAHVRGLVSSPPYRNGLGKEDTYTDQHKRSKDSHHRIMTEKGIADPYYGSDPANLGNLPPGDVTTVVSSMPYADGCAHTGGADAHPEHIQGGKRSVALGYTTVVSSPNYGGNEKSDRRVTDAHGQDRDQRRGWQQGHGSFRGSETYGKSEGQLGALPMGELTLVSSPPYATLNAPICEGNVGGHPSGAHASIARSVTENKKGEGYGTTEGQLAQYPRGTSQDVMGVSSPPSMSSDKKPTALGTGRPTRAEGDGAGRNTGDDHDPTSPGQLGTEGPLTFWHAASQVMAEVAAILPPGATAVWICQSFVRDNALVDFPGDWERLCVHHGFRTVERILASRTETYGEQTSLFNGVQPVTVERIGFFRRLAQKKGAPVIPGEWILIMRRED